MRAVEEEIVIEEDGQIHIDELPVRAGDRVKLIILLPDEDPSDKSHRPLYPLRGTQPYRFTDPTAPVAPEDWEPGK